MELQEYLEQETQEREGFVIDDDSKANWALRKIASFIKKQKKNNELAQAEIEKIESWNKEENEKIQQDIDFFQAQLAVYATQKREEEPKNKSWKLPNGRIKFVKQQPKWNYDDEKLLESLKGSELNDFINVKESPNKPAIKKSFAVNNGVVVNPDTGEFLEGVTVEERPDQFKVEVDES